MIASAGLRGCIIAREHPVNFPSRVRIPAAGSCGPCRLPGRVESFSCCVRLSCARVNGGIVVDYRAVVSQKRRVREREFHPAERDYGSSAFEFGFGGEGVERRRVDGCPRCGAGLLGGLLDLWN